MICEFVVFPNSQMGNSQGVWMKRKRERLRGGPRDEIICVSSDTSESDPGVCGSLDVDLSSIVAHMVPTTPPDPSKRARK